MKSFFLLQHWKYDISPEACQVCPKKLCSLDKYTLQHYAACHIDDATAAENVMKERFGLKLHKDTNKFVKYGDGAKHPGGNMNVRVMQIGEDLFACPICDETFPTRLTANKHTRAQVRSDSSLFL